MQFLNESEAKAYAEKLCIRTKMTQYVNKLNKKFYITTKNGRGNVVREITYSEVAGKASKKVGKEVTDENPDIDSKKNKPAIRKNSQVSGDDKGA